MQWALWHFCTILKRRNAHCELTLVWPHTLYSFGSGLRQDKQYLLFGENTVQVHTLSLVASVETALLHLTLRVEAA